MQLAAKSLSHRVNAVSLWKGFLGLLLILMGTPARGESDQASDIRSPRQPQVLVLKSGRVVLGKIRSRGDGYDVRHKIGNEFISSQQVWLVAVSLTEAHQLMRDSYPSLTPDVHLQIATWCANNQLWGTARGELLDALHKDPHRDDVRRALAQIVRRQKAMSERKPASASNSESDAVTQAIAVRTVMKQRALGGLPFEQAREFTTRIQPLLSNKCAKCHRANSGRKFVIESVRNGSTAAIARRNVASVIEQVRTTADGERFLAMATMKHGAMTTAPFTGPLGQTQSSWLLEWVNAVQQTLGNAVAEHRPAKADGVVLQVGHHDVDGERNTIDSLAPDVDTHAAARVAGDHEAVVMQDIERRIRNDKFNPEVFNRRYRTRAVPYRPDTGRVDRR